MQSLQHSPAVPSPAVSHILIAEQNRTYAESLSHICAEIFPHARLDVHCEATVALDALRDQCADVLLLGLSFEDMDIVDLLDLIGNERLARHILIISARWSEHILVSLRTARFNGAVDTATESIEAVKLALHSILHGEFYVSTNLRRYLLDDLPGASGIRELTTAELKVLRVIGTGSDNQEAAAQLGLSSATVQTHRRNIMRKLKVSTSPKLVREAVRLGIVRIAPVTGFPRNAVNSGFKKILPKVE